MPVLNYRPYPTVEAGTAPPNVYSSAAGATPDAFGASVGQALQGVGQKLERAGSEWASIALEQQQLHNRIVADQQISSFEDKVNKVMYGDPEVAGDVGYMGLKGQAALDQRGPTRAKIDQILQEHRQVLQNPHQQLAFDNQTRRYRNYLLVDVGRHYNTEFTRWGTEVTEGRANSALGNAGIAANNGDDGAWQTAFATGRTALSDGLTKLGHPPEFVDAKVREYDEKAATDYAKKLAVRSPWLADKFIDENRRYLPSTYDNLKAGLKTERDKILKDHIANGTPLPEGATFQIQGDRGLARVPNFSAPAGPAIAGATPREQQYLNEIRHRESGADYKKVGPTGDYGAYQFQDPTWKDATTASGIGKEYARASDAPPAVQDAVALYWFRQKGTQPWKASGPYGEDGTVEQRQSGAIRNLPIATTVNAQLERAATAVGDLKVEVFSGGQPSAGPNRTGSHRHDEGGAADIQLRDVKTNRLLDMRNPDDRARMQKFITEAVAAGATGVGAAEDYMGPHGIHIGGGTPAAWGRGGSSANAPDWVRTAFEAGRGVQNRATGAPAPASAVAARPTAATPPATGGEVAVGDSIAAHLIRKAGVSGKEDATTIANRRAGDTAVSGFGPNAIRDEVIPNMSDADIRDKHVILSSGATNKPGEIAAVAQQIQALRNRGASAITLLGVGNDPRLNGVNEKLAEIAAANNAAFAGPMRKVASDKIHSDDNQDLLAQVRGAQRPTQPDTPGAPPSATATASDGSAPVRVEPLAGAAAPASPTQPQLPGPDRLLRDLPEPEQGTLPDSELGDAYRKRLEEAAKRVPPGTSQEVWHGAVTQIRREMSWELSMKRRDAQIAEQQAKAAMHQAENEIYRDVYSPSPKITPQQIATDPRFDVDPTRRRQMLELVNNPPGSAVPPAQSWAAAQSLIERIRLPEGDQNKIVDTGQIYDNMRLLNKPDFEFVIKQFNDIRTPGGQTLSKLRDDFVKRYSGFITKSNPMAGIVDAVGEARLYEFERYIDQQVDGYKKAGKDPTALFTDTGSPTFLGHESVIRRFQPTPEQSRQAISGMAGGSVTPLPPVNRPEPPPAPPPMPVPRPLPGGGVEVPLPPPPAGNDNDAARRPGETPDQYYQRRGMR